MLLKVCATGSSGNGYALYSDDGDILIIECGCKFIDMKRTIDFDLSRVKGCIVSHEHG